MILINEECPDTFRHLGNYEKIIFLSLFRFAALALSMLKIIGEDYEQIMNAL